MVFSFFSDVCFCFTFVSVFSNVNTCSWTNRTFNNRQYCTGRRKLLNLKWNVFVHLFYGTNDSPNRTGRAFTRSDKNIPVSWPVPSAKELLFSTETKSFGYRTDGKDAERNRTGHACVDLRVRGERVRSFHNICSTLKCLKTVVHARACLFRQHATPCYSFMYDRKNACHQLIYADDA